MADLYDVIVAGGGPAGATAAWELGRAGLRVLVLEKARPPRYKPCGGGVPARLLESFPFEFGDIVESSVRSVGYALAGHTVHVPMPEGEVRMVMRDRFDAHILAQARAEVLPDTPVVAVEERADGVLVRSRGGREFQGRYLLGTDGASSAVAREVGLRRGRPVAAAIEAEVTPPPAVMERFRDAPLFVFGEIPRGYLWIFPKARHLSVGVGSFRPRRGELQATLARVMARYDVPLDGARLHGHPLPVYTRSSPVATARTLLAGDAAGLVDPLTGEGIRFAVKSGRLAAHALAMGRPELYPALVRRHIGLSHDYALWLSLVFYTFPHTSYALGVTNPRATRAFADLLSDRADYPQVAARLAASLPRHVAAEWAGAAWGALRGRAAGDRARARVRGAPTGPPGRGSRA